MDRLLSVVVSVYNEEKALEDFYKETTGILKDIDWAYELIFVNDGSSDQSLAILERLSASDRAVKVVSFSRNFGHEAAMIAGLDYSSGMESSAWTQTCSIRRNAFRSSWSG